MPNDNNEKPYQPDWRHDGPLSARNDEKHMPAVVTPPTVHDSDRRASEAIHRFDDAIDADIETTALIIARHHAEERAAVERVLQKALLSLEYTDAFLARQHSANWESAATTEVRAALTALRTVSQSPTK